VSSNSLVSRAERYAALVAERKAFDPMPLGLANPASVPDAPFDSDHVGPWTVWAHDLEADLMVVGQDWGDVNYFRTNRGLDKAGNPTNKALQRLLASVGRSIPDPPLPGASNALGSSCGVWLTNASLWLKTGGLSAPVKTNWFGEHAMALLRAQVELVEPRVVVALGERAYRCLLNAYSLPIPKGPFRVAVEAPRGTPLPRDRTTTLVAVYHCGARVQNTLRPLSQQLADWERVSVLLAEE
jgi:uracil-DNA glycosylase